MSVHGCSFAEFADKYNQIGLKDVKYLGFRDVPHMLQKYTKGNVALDYGCGPGKSMMFLQKLGFLVDGVDINENMIKLAREELPKNNFKVLQDGNIPTEDEHYDLVFSSWVLQEIGPKDELVAALSEITRVLKKDGTFIAIVPSEAAFGGNWSDFKADFEENKNLKSGDKGKMLFKENNFIIRPYFWTDNDYRDAMREAGLEIMLMHVPFGEDDDGFVWVNEKEIGICNIYVAKKIIQELRN